MIAKGRTNIERMEQGLAPIGHDGKSINLHHKDQTNNSDILEITATEHRKRYAELHTNTGQTPSQINRKEFSNWRSRYWRNRAKEFKKKFNT